MSTRTLTVAAAGFVALIVGVIALLVARSALGGNARAEATARAPSRHALTTPVRLKQAQLPVRMQRGCLGARTSTLIQWRGSLAPRVANLPMTQVEPAPRGPLVAGTYRGSLVVVNVLTGRADQVWPRVDDGEEPGATFQAEWAPNGEQLLVVTSGPSASETVAADAFVWSARSKRRTPVERAWSGTWSPSGRYLLVRTDGQDEVRTTDGLRTVARVPESAKPGTAQQVAWVPRRDILIVAETGNDRGSDGSSWLIWPTGPRQRVGPELRAEGYNGELGRVVVSPDGTRAAGMTEANALVLMKLGRRNAEVTTRDLVALARSPIIPPRFFTLVEPPEPVEPYLRASAIANDGSVAVSATRHIGDADYFVDALFWLAPDGSTVAGHPTETLFDLDRETATPAVVLHQSPDDKRIAAVLPPFPARLAVASSPPWGRWSIVDQDFDSAIIDDAVHSAAVRSTNGDVSIVSLSSPHARQDLARGTRAWRRAARLTDPPLNLAWALDNTAVVITCSRP